MLTKTDFRIETLIKCFNSDDNEFKAFYDKAIDITFRNFGLKRELFNPIYVSDICLADCPYCGYRVSNKGVQRKTLKPSEILQEANFLIKRGVKNILLLAGDYKHDKYLEMLKENIKAIKELNNTNWLGVEVATLEIEEYKILMVAGAESVTVFQETYNRKRYSELHKNMQYKGDFDFRYDAQERAILAGIKEVGFGVLYGVGFWKDDTIQMAEHAFKIQERYPFVKLRFSFPRLQLSKGQDESCKTEEISEMELLKAIVGIRLLFPKASLVLTGRESVEYLIRSASVVNVLGYNGATSVGGYTQIGYGFNQFELNKKSAYDNFREQLSLKGYGTLLA